MQVTLKKPHTHAGEEKPVGTTLTLDDDLGQWLVDLDVAEQALITPPQRGSKKDKDHAGHE